MGHSFFLESRTTNAAKLPVSFLLLEAVQNSIANNPEISLLAAVTDAAGIAFDKTPGNNELKALALRVHEASVKSQESADEKATAPPSKMTLGSSFMQWIGELPAEKLCFLMADFDPKVAEILYCHTDYQLVGDMADIYLASRWKHIEADFEACMYGFGGGYKGDSKSGGGEDGASVDLTKGIDQAGHNALRSMGF